MTAAQRSRILVLAALVVVLTGVLAWPFWPATAAMPAAGARPAPARGRPATATPPRPVDPRALDVRLEALQSAVEEPAATGRDPFSFRPVAPVAPPAPPVPPGGRPGGMPTTPGENVPAGPPPPAPPPPITLKFIGLIVEAGAGGRIAVLSDGRFVFHGRPGDIIEGRYRVVRIGDESLEMEHVDGRGRQTIRLSGS